MTTDGPAEYSQRAGGTMAAISDEDARKALLELGERIRRHVEIATGEDPPDKQVGELMGLTYQNWWLTRERPELRRVTWDRFFKSLRHWNTETHGPHPRIRITADGSGTFYLTEMLKD